MTIRPHMPVILRGQRLWPRLIRYQLGGGREPVESELVTLRHYTPVSEARSLAEWLSEGGFSFEPHFEKTECSSTEYNGGLKLESDRLFPVRVPTEAGQVLAEGTCYHAIEVTGGSTTYYRIHYWLESV